MQLRQISQVLPRNNFCEILFILYVFMSRMCVRVCVQVDIKITKVFLAGNANQVEQLSIVICNGYRFFVDNIC